MSHSSEVVVILGGIGIEYVPDPSLRQEHPTYILSTTSPLSMKKQFPIVMGEKKIKFNSRNHLILYVQTAINVANDLEEPSQLTKVAAMKTSPSKIEGTDWTYWAYSIAYAIAKKTLNAENTEEVNGVVGAAGSDRIWELAQDRTVANRTTPQHAWGRNIWGEAVTVVVEEIREVKSTSTHPLDTELGAFLSKKSESGLTVREVLAQIKYTNGSSVWDDVSAKKQFLYCYREAVREDKSGNPVPLLNLIDWVWSVKHVHLATYDFVASLPFMSIVNRDRDRDQAARTVLNEGTVSVERCKRCRGNVTTTTAHTGGGDESGGTLVTCAGNCYTENKEGERVRYSYILKHTKSHA